MALPSHRRMRHLRPAPRLRLKLLMTASRGQAGGKGSKAAGRQQQAAGGRRAAGQGRRRRRAAGRAAIPPNAARSEQPTMPRSQTI